MLSFSQDALDVCPALCLKGRNLQAFPVQGQGRLREVLPAAPASMYQRSYESRRGACASGASPAGHTGRNEAIACFRAYDGGAIFYKEYPNKRLHDERCAKCVSRAV